MLFFFSKSGKPPRFSKEFPVSLFFVFEMFDIVATRVFKYFRFNIFELNNNRLYARQERPLTSPFDSRSQVRSQATKKEIYVNRRIAT